MNTFTYNDITSKMLGFAIKTKPIYRIAQRDFTLVSVPGKSGDVIVDNGRYGNVELSYQINSNPVWVNAPDTSSLIQQFANWLTNFDGNYKELRDTYNPGYFTKAICTNIDEITSNLKKHLDTTVSFSRLPYWYSDLGQTPIITSKTEFTIHNPEQITSAPYIRLKGSGIINLFLNGEKILSTNQNLSGQGDNNYIEIDSELQNVFQGKKDCNNYVSADYLPEFKPGDNIIKIEVGKSAAVTSFFSEIEIVPRWRRL